MDGSGCPLSGTGIDPLPGGGRPIKVGEFILGYPGEAGVPWPRPGPDHSGRSGTFVGLREYHSRLGAFNRPMRANGKTEHERELLADKLLAPWLSGVPLTLARALDEPALAADSRRNNDFTNA